MLTSHEARRRMSLCCVAIYLHHWRVAVIVDGKLELGSGHRVSGTPLSWMVPVTNTKMNPYASLGQCDGPVPDFPQYAPVLADRLYCESVGLFGAYQYPHATCGRIAGTAVHARAGFRGRGWIGVGAAVGGPRAARVHVRCPFTSTLPFLP